MITIIATAIERFFGTPENIEVNARVNRVAGLAAAEKYDGRVLKITGNRAKVCWPKGEKTVEDLNSLVLIAE
ncbi:hypothetical protein SAMN02745857_03764 [Andreprevotia lacus DSM 23236]|jgi:hypothetical protein|uniref:Uncharacterized protein n=1 Tax=Andreprevotia lacus DSM 23236 TaxID=1121001 RepID=A0A1W1XZM1_9NEIS|nr:hypothetical protein [Andreprevotia lacus]SMC29325.1 hypothetical protein SAMN02745857_03764 [Andreprevotia lacus DSM 23236]